MRQHAQNTTFGLFAEASLFRLTGWFHIHFFSSKELLRKLVYFMCFCLYLPPDIYFIVDKTHRANSFSPDFSRCAVNYITALMKRPQVVHKDRLVTAVTCYLYISGYCLDK